MSNFANAQYTVVAKLGAPEQQQLSVVPDTGSFNLLVASTLCTDRGCQAHRRFDAAHSRSFVASSRDATVTLTYGQGSIVAEAGSDTVRLGALVHENTTLLLMRRQSLAHFEVSSYDGVMGLGKNDASPEGNKALLTSLGINSFGVCLGQAEDSSGRLDLGQRIPELEQQYTSLPSIGQVHWGLALSSIRAGGRALPGVCADSQGCAAIIDSGTSLMTLPTAALDVLFEAIGVDYLDALQEQEECGGAAFDALDDVTFTLGGKTLSLPPSLYMGAMDVSVPDEVKIGPFRFRVAAPGVRCVPLFTSLDTRTQHNGPLVILGMPFLRAHAAAFDRSSKTVSFAPIDPGGPLASLCDGCDKAAAEAAAAAAGDLAAPVPSNETADADEGDIVALATRAKPGVPIAADVALQPSGWAHADADAASGRRRARRPGKAIRLAMRHARLPWWALDPTWRHVARNGSRIAAALRANTSGSWAFEL